MNKISSSTAVSMAYDSFSNQPVNKPSERELQISETFQDFVAGTFYKQMFKALRRMHKKPAYLHGGQAEQMFQGQLDQQLAEDLAHNNGSAFSDPLFSVFMRRIGAA